MTAPLEHNPQLTTKQANVLMQKIIRTFEEETGNMPADGKAKSRMQLPEDLIAARRAVQWWVPAGREVLSRALSADDFQEVETTVPQSNVLDQEVPTSC